LRALRERQAPAHKLYTVHRAVPCHEFICLPEYNPHHYEQIDDAELKRRNAEIGKQ
jgi:hypothetical protein